MTTVYRLLSLFLVFVLLQSCASILNPQYQSFTVHTSQPSEVRVESQTKETINNKANFGVERKKQPLVITTVSDSLQKTFVIKPRNSFAYWSNIYFNYGIGMLIDQNNPKRYSYPRHIYINSTDTTLDVSRYNPITKKGELHLHLAIPYINTFQLTPRNEQTKSNTGFWGLTIGLDYYHQANQFISLSISGATDFFVPIPAAVDISGEYELMSARSVMVSNNHHIKRFIAGYGISFVRNTWDLRYYDQFNPSPPSRDPVKKSHYALGLVFPAYYKLSKNFHIGAVYRPTFLRFKIDDAFRYEHLISIDFLRKIKLRR